MTLAILILLFAVLSIIIYSFYNGIAPLPTSPTVKRQLILSLPNTVQGPIIELGSGFGTLTFSLCKHFPKHTIIAFENSLLPYFYTWILSKIKRIPNLKIYRQNFYHFPLQDFGLIVCYLYPGAMKKLRHKFANEITPSQSSQWILSHTFALPDAKPFVIYEAKDIYKSKIYLYKSCTF